MKFKLEFYHFQKDILKKFENEIKRGDKKIHIVAPPGSGKTIVGLEMILRFSGNALVLIPNITLQYQWKDKIEKMFLEENEKIENLVSTNVNIVKKVNIITYQALTQSGEGDDIILQKIKESWYNDFKEEFKNFQEFEEYLENFKTENPEDFVKTFSKYRKRQKNIINVEKIITEKVKDYFILLKENNIDVIIVDEAHHLTNWWSNVIFYLWKYLGEKFIIGLTATPPFENTDFFILDDDYSNLLGEVDFYVPQPAIIKSGKLAPYQDLVYFVGPTPKLQSNLQIFESQLQGFLSANNEKICEVLFEFLKGNYNKLLKDSQQLLFNILQYLYHNSEKNIQQFIFTEEIGNKLKFEDIAKSIGKYISIKKINTNKNLDDIKKIFYNLGYIWRGANFFRFRTPIEMQFIYSKSKILGVEKILDKETKQLGENLRCAIITDFLEENENNFLNCKFLLENLGKKYKEHNPVLVSGQGNFQIGKDGKIEIIDETILELTEKFSKGEIKIIIGTRGILGEGWDCPKLNTLIDLTGIVAYMSVNQVRGRVIRLDYDNLRKTANVYDIVCIGNGIKGDIDMERLISKHDKFYGIDGSGLIIKGINHIYPNLKENYLEYEKINQNMIKRIGLREYIYDLWAINGEFLNKEIFGLNLHIDNYGQIFPITYINIFDKIGIFFYRKKSVVLEKIGENDFYHKVLVKFLSKFIGKITKTLKRNKMLPRNFKYKILSANSTDIKIVSNYYDDLITKSFITYLHKIFSIITNQRYILEIPFNKLGIKENYYFGLGDELVKNKRFRKNLERELMGFFINNRTKILYLNSDKIDKKNYIGKRPFITGKIEKLWI